MNREETKIIGCLSDNLGSGGSIQDMAKKIKARYGVGYYSNVYNAIKGLEKKKIVKIEEQGKSRLIRMDFDNPNSIYYLSEAESRKSSEIRIPKELLAALLDVGLERDAISICALEAEKHLKINRIELLFLMHGPTAKNLIGKLRDMEFRHGVKIDPVILTLGEFEHIMKTGEPSVIKNMLLDRSILYNAEGFWRIIMKRGINGGYRRMDRELYDLTPNELAYNYGRFGYALYGRAEEAGAISLEETIFLMSTKTEARIKYGAIVLLYKNKDIIKWGFLYYLYKRYDELGRLGGMLASIGGIGKSREDENIRYYRSIIEDTPADYDSRTIARYLKTYG